jgi:hypothetical protein
VPAAIVALGPGRELEVVVLHVLEEARLPSFTEQPQHESNEWAREFLHRYCPTGVGKVQLEFRVGETAHLVAVVAEEFDVDVIALGWAQELAADRAPVVRATLARSTRPVALVPVRTTAANVPTTPREESWTSLPSLRA